ncbi:MAG: GxxExxY protein [Bacteroidota bacterium]|nr:GxxExxY protein [Bacteroidota bacterium]
MNDETSYLLQQETHTIIGVCMEVHKELGHGLLEVVYKDAIEYELKLKNILYQRGKEYPVRYKDSLLPHKFYADFVVFDSVILEIKAQKGIVEENYKQIINYLALSKLKIGLIFNFGEPSLKFRRVIF